MQKIFIYSDASFDKKHKIGVAGYMILNNTNQIIKTFHVHEENNNRVEFRSVIEALNSITNFDAEITIYTDSKAITNIIDRQKELETRNFISKRSNKILSNADIYKEFFELYKNLKPKLVWTKGHCPKENRNEIQNNFSIIDKLVRKELRSVINEIEINKQARAQHYTKL